MTGATSQRRVAADVCLLPGRAAAAQAGSGHRNHVRRLRKPPMQIFNLNLTIYFFLTWENRVGHFMEFLNDHV